jgi:cytochrome c peroxidase
MINLRGAVYEGSIPGRFGNRKPPSAAYAGDSLSLSHINGMFWGGMFWDGRATGWTLGDPLAEQAQGPFLNPAEQALRDNACVVYIVVNSGYYSLYKQVWGEINIDWMPYNIEEMCAVEGPKLTLTNDDRAKVDTAYDNIARSIAAYERSSKVSSFSSKFDRFWDKANSSRKDVTLIDMTNWWDYRNLGLNSLELKGLALFNDQTKGKCSLCHVLAEPNVKPLFTDFTYDNLGVPKNPMNPVYKSDPGFIDLGLGGFLATTEDYAQYAGANYGKHKVPPLRNVDKRPYPWFIKAYSHNGYFKSLYSIVHFYNTRDRLASCDSKRFPLPGFNCWPEAEVLDNVNTTELGNLRLSFFEEWAIVEFLKTLSDK